MEMEFGWWWCSFDCDLMMPYVFIVFIDACGWIPCHMMPWSHGSCSWWRWPCLDHMMTLSWSLDGDDLHWWRWLLDEFRPCWGWHDSLMEMTWWCLALIRWWRWHDDVLLWFVDGDDMMMSCHDWYVDDIPCWWWHDTFMCLMGCWWAYEPCDEVSYTLSFIYPCASPTYSCNPLQDPHTPILNPNTPSYTLPCILHYPFTLPIT